MIKTSVLIKHRTAILTEAKKLGITELYVSEPSFIRVKYLHFIYVSNSLISQDNIENLKKFIISLTNYECISLENKERDHKQNVELLIPLVSPTLKPVILLEALDDRPLAEQLELGKSDSFNSKTFDSLMQRDIALLKMPEQLIKEIKNFDQKRIESLIQLTNAQLEKNNPIHQPGFCSALQRSQKILMLHSNNGLKYHCINFFFKTKKYYNQVINSSIPEELKEQIKDFKNDNKKPETSEKSPIIDTLLW